MDKTHTIVTVVYLKSQEVSFFPLNIAIASEK